MLDSFFTLESLLSLQGAAIASLLVPNVFGYLIGKNFDKYRKYISLVIAFGISFFIAILAEVGWPGFVVAFFNGCLIFASAVGINQMSQKKEVSVQMTQVSSAKVKAMKTKARVIKPKKKFFSNWFGK